MDTLLRMRLEISSHNIRAIPSCERDRQVLLRYSRNFAEYSLPDRSGRSEQKCIYAASTLDRREFRFHKHSLDDLKNHLRGSGYQENEHYDVVEIPLYTPAKATLGFTTEKQPREDQPSQIAYVLAEGTSKLLELQTGKGKTYVALYCAAQLGVRTAVVLKGMYVDRWVLDMRDSPKSILKVPKDRMWVIRGSHDLKQLIELAKTNQLDVDVLVFSTRTLHQYYRDWHNYSDPDMYGVEPGKFWETLKVGFVINDELHQEFHFHFIKELFSHVPKLLSLSATLVSKNTMLKRMYKIAYPDEIRTSPGEYDKYALVYNLQYTLNQPNRLKWIGGKGFYSHTTYELSIMKQPKVRERYYEMVYRQMVHTFFETRESHHKALVYMATIQMCDQFCEYLKKKHPELNIIRYVEKDPYEKLIEADVSVSTLIKSGTAVDIPNLREVYNTIAVSSEAANLQALGRLRKKEDEPEHPRRYWYFSCTNIPTHVKYHHEKLDLFKTRVVSHSTINIPWSIG